MSELGATFIVEELELRLSLRGVIDSLHGILEFLDIGSLDKSWVLCRDLREEKTMGSLRLFCISGEREAIEESFDDGP